MLDHRWAAQTTRLVLSLPDPMQAFIYSPLFHRQVRNSGPRGNTEVFNVGITERGTGFVERVEIDEDNDIEYFSVPSHNDVLGADYLFDFKMVSFQSRNKVNTFLHPH